MIDTYQESVFDFQKQEKSIDNLISLFIIDDYPDSQKTIFNKVFMILKSDGYFFFSSYSPNDERGES